MQTRTIPSGDGGYVKFSKGANAFAKPLKIEPGSNKYATEGEDDTDRQIQFVFAAKSAEEGDDTFGLIPGYFNSKITVRDDDEWSSNLAKLLKAAGVLEDVLRDVGFSDEGIKEIIDGDEMAFPAFGSEEENIELYEAVVTRLGEVDDFVVKVGTTFAGDDADYSKVNDVLERSDVDVPDIDLDDEEDEDDGETETEHPMVEG